MSLNRSKGRLRFNSTDDGQNDRSDEKVIEAAAVRLLARREHSAGEIKRKLQSRGYASGAIDTVLVRLTDQGMLSDLRFVTSFISQHAQRGHGPARIRAELRQQGVAPDVIEEQIRSADIDWDVVAAQVRERKFRTVPRSLSERAKQSRFLQYRGFNTEQIRAAMGRLSRTGESEPDAADIDLSSDSSS